MFPSWLFLLSYLSLGCAVTWRRTGRYGTQEWPANWSYTAVPGGSFGAASTSRGTPRRSRPASQLAKARDPDRLTAAQPPPRGKAGLLPTHDDDLRGLLDSLRRRDAAPVPALGSGQSRSRRQKGELLLEVWRDVAGNDRAVARCCQTRLQGLVHGEGDPPRGKPEDRS